MQSLFLANHVNSHYFTHINKYFLNCNLLLITYTYIYILFLFFWIAIVARFVHLYRTSRPCRPGYYRPVLSISCRCCFVLAIISLLITVIYTAHLLSCIIKLSQLFFWTVIALRLACLCLAFQMNLLVRHRSPCLSLREVGFSLGVARLTPRFYLDLRSQHYLGGGIWLVYLRFNFSSSYKLKNPKPRDLTPNDLG